MTVTEYIRRKYALLFTCYIRRDGKGYYLVDGKEIPEAEFKAMHKLPTVLNRNMENPDKTRLWLG